MTRSPRFPFLIPAPRAKRNDDDGPRPDARRALQDGIGIIERAADTLLKRDQADREIGDFFRRLIPALDALEAARLAVLEAGEPEWKRGIDLFREKLFDLFSSFEFVAAAEIGERFDPARHRAVGTEERADAPEGVVTQVILGGWSHRGRLLRAADVVVSKKARREP